ncbi:MAG: ACP S-malonyltransferase [Planctomycetes bacterium]|nr:ACP S-malonyltransferase [Planctomycetota bacterium]
MKRIAFLFPGQGAQYVGMGRVLLETSPSARRRFDEANERLGYDLASVCLEGPSELLDSTVQSQPAIYVTSLAALDVLRAGRPDVVAGCEAAAGLSLGEFTALTFAGVLAFEDGLRVVQRRGEAMQAASDARSSGMVSILGLEIPRIEELCAQASADGEILRIANDLCPGNTVVSGDQAACERISELAVEAGAMRTIPLAVAGAFHTPIMGSAVDRLAETLAGVTLERGRIPVYSNVDGSPHTDPREIHDLLIQQVVSPVRWAASMRAMLAEGFQPFFEIGPGRVLTGLLKRFDRKIPCENTAC